jgi:hypothetical protein
MSVNSASDVIRDASGTRSKTRSILYDWVQELGLRHQGVLLASIRGCDGVAKHDPSKAVMRAIRAVVLVPFDARELVEPKGFMYYEPDAFIEGINTLAKGMDEYPVHFIWHLIHAVEVIGYKHPEASVRYVFHAGYYKLVKKFHVQPESEQAMDSRLTEDRIKDNTVAG